VRFRALQQFFTWLVDEDEIAVSPIGQVALAQDSRAVDACPRRRCYPGAAETPVPAGTSPSCATQRSCGCSWTPGCASTSWRSSGWTTSIWSTTTAAVLGKGRRPRVCPFGAKTAQALDRYLRWRARQKRGDLPKLWLGVNGRGAMTDNGIAPVVCKRGVEAGLNGLHPHVFRHTLPSSNAPTVARPLRGTEWAWVAAPWGMRARTTMGGGAMTGLKINRLLGEINHFVDLPRPPSDGTR
jgi:integrase/recombinase XerC